MENLSIYLCLKLKEHHKEYNKENGTKISFAKFLKILQYTRKDRDLIFNTMGIKQCRHGCKNYKIQK